MMRSESSVGEIVSVRACHCRTLHLRLQCAQDARRGARADGQRLMLGAEADELTEELARLRT